MGIETKIKLLNQDEKSLYRAQKVHFSSSISMKTPAKTIDLSQFNQSDPLKLESREFMEIFKRFNADGIAKLTTESKADDNLVKWFNSQENKFDLNEENTPIITITEFDEERLPTTDEIGFLIETLYPHSHIVTIPIIPSINKMKKSENFDSYKTYLNSCIKTIEDLNHKPIMGTVPKLPRNQLNELIEFYADQGINSFLLDLNGSSPMAFGTHSFRFLSALKRNKLLDNSFILAHNVGIRVNKKEDNIPAKDILGFGLGYNALGNKHKKLTPNRQFIEYLKLNPENKFRLFNKNDYGYWKGTFNEQMRKIYPTDSSIPIETFKKTKYPSRLQKQFNEEQLALETNNLFSLINKEPEKSLDYLRDKKYVEKNDLKVIENSTKKIK